MDGESTGRARGGVARALALTDRQRSEIASAAAKARWSGNGNESPGELPRATHRGELTIGETKIPCAVLEDGKRVVTENGITVALLGSRSGASKRLKKQGAPMPMFLAPGNLRPFIPDDLVSGPLKPVVFRDGRRTVVGFDATLLPSVCDVWLRAREADALQEQQQDKAMKAEILMRGLAHVGIIALVDEATGYQRERARDALARILEEFIAKELRPWVHTFPDDFYSNLFRLRGIEYPRDTVKRPQYFGHLTNDIVYRRLAPGVLDEIKKVTPKRLDGRPKHHFHRRLSESTGHPRLREHLSSVLTIMKLSSDYQDFEEKLNRVHPRYGANLVLPGIDDEGRGL